MWKRIFWVLQRVWKTRYLSEKSGCFISVFGKTVAIIGRPDGIERARKAVEMLLEGANHSTVYRFLDSRALEEHRFEL